MMSFTSENRGVGTTGFMWTIDASGQESLLKWRLRRLTHFSGAIALSLEKYYSRRSGVGALGAGNGSRDGL
jgi:hypothetical protein